MAYTNENTFLPPHFQSNDSKTVTANYIASKNDATVRVDTTTGNVSVTLPTTGLSNGKTFNVKKIVAANTVTVVGTIDGATNYTITSVNKVVTVQWNGTNYDIISVY